MSVPHEPLHSSRGITDRWCWVNLGAPPTPPPGNDLDRAQEFARIPSDDAFERATGMSFKARAFEPFSDDFKRACEEWLEFVDLTSVFETDDGAEDLLSTFATKFILPRACCSAFGKRTKHARDTRVVYLARSGTDEDVLVSRSMSLDEFWEGCCDTLLPIIRNAAIKLGEAGGLVDPVTGKWKACVTCGFQIIDRNGAVHFTVQRGIFLSVEQHAYLRGGQNCITATATPIECESDGKELMKEHERLNLIHDVADFTGSRHASSCYAKTNFKRAVRADIDRDWQSFKWGHLQ